MCKESSSPEDHSVNNAFSENNETEEVVENTTEKHIIPRRILIDYIKSLDNSTSKESFITPSMALKMIHFVHLLNYQLGASAEMANSLVHKWYKKGIDDEKVVPFNQRTKSIDELLIHLEADCELNNVVKD